MLISDFMKSNLPYIQDLLDHIDTHCHDIKPWKLILLTTGSTLVAVYIHSIIFDNEESFKQKIKKNVFYWIRAIPAVRRRIEKEQKNARLLIEKDMNKHTAQLKIYKELPKESTSSEKILDETKSYLKLGDYNWTSGSLSGSVYNVDEQVTELVTTIYKLTAWTNPLHPDVFPGIRKMEAEVVQMGIQMFHGGPNACGTMTSGGTESILMACKAYRDYAREVRGIRYPEILCAVSAHAAFEKAAQLFRMGIVFVPVDPVTFKADVKAMKRAITSNTCMLVASAPGFPHGIIDSVEEIAALGKKYNIPVHVDACLGGFVIAFMEEAGYRLPPFDFRVEGVTSISADTHKYGYVPKGSSIVMYSDPVYRHYQFFVITDWPGGIYGSPTIAGSRPGSLIAVCWATMMYYGRKGYVEATKKIVETHKYIENEVRKMDGIKVLGHPDACVVAMNSDVFNIYRLSDAMTKKGWSLSPLQFPSSIHICVTYLHTKDGVAQRFIKDMQDTVKEILRDPNAKAGGTAAIYGLAQSIPDRSMVTDVTRTFLDTIYNL